MTKLFRISFLIVLTVLFSQTLFARPVLSGSTDRGVKNYCVNEKIVFKLILSDEGKPLAGKEILYKLERENFCPSSSGKLVTGPDGSATLEISSGNKPGFLLLRATLSAARGSKKEKPVSCLVGAAVSPEKLETKIAEPSDFDAFWDGCRKELSSVPLKVLKKERIDVSKLPKFIQKRCSGIALAGKMISWDIALSCAGPRPATGVLTMPANAAEKSLPAIVNFQGAGVHPSVPNFSFSFYSNVILFSVNAHGLNPVEDGPYYSKFAKNELKNYIYRLSEDRNKNYFKYMILRDLRALEYLKTLPEWDGKTLIVKGVSQGGAQSLAVASLDPSVTLCVAGVPWMTAVTAAVEGRFMPRWPRLVPVSAPGKCDLSPECFDNLRYFDNANLVRRMKAECHIAYGLSDTCCIGGGIWITYNHIPGKNKSILAFQGGHGSTNQNGVIDRYLKKVRASGK